MATKEKVLELFEKNKGIYFSGEEIAQLLSVSRAAVWKAVNVLRKEGYSIDAVTNKGYCLSEKTDILSPQGIFKYLNPEYQNTNIHVLATAESSNALVREKANAGCLEGYMIIANEQVAGKGRYGRQFFSPDKTGIYMSLLLRPVHCPATKALKLTTMAAVAVCEAIEDVSSQQPQIKWVNDIYIKGKKVCGILTEASLSLESGMVEYAVLGVGINVYLPENGFPQELQQIAGAIFDIPQNDMKNRMTAAFINRFMDYYTGKNKADYTEKYRQYSLIIGKTVTVLSANKNSSAFVYGIDDECRLLVRYDDGREDVLSCGEISIRL